MQGGQTGNGERGHPYPLVQKPKSLQGVEDSEKWQKAMRGPGAQNTVIRKVAVKR